MSMFSGSKATGFNVKKVIQPLQTANCYPLVNYTQ